MIVFGLGFFRGLLGRFEVIDVCKVLFFYVVGFSFFIVVWNNDFFFRVISKVK